MYAPIPGGSTITIGEDDLKMKVHLPPVGYVWNHDTNQLEETEIICRSSIKEDQYWERPKWPDNYLKRSRREKELQAKDPEYADPDLSAYRAREWHRRLYGAWFMNNGEYVYLPGSYYFYLAHWTIDVGAPKFKLADLEKAYFWQYCCEDPNSYGGLIATKRRVGKCFKKGTKIRMFDGSIKLVENIKDGDLVMGNDSTDRLVYGTTSGTEDMFEIIPNKGESFTVNRSHIIYCVRRKYSKRLKRNVTQELKYTVGEYLELSDSAKAGLKLVRTGWDLPERTHFIDPYFIGAWLGDGSSRGCEITNEDPEVIEYIKLFAETHGLTYNNYGPRTRKGVHLRHVVKGSISRRCIHNGVEYRCREEMMRALGKNVKTPIKGFGPYLRGEVQVADAIGNPVWEEMKRLNLPNNKHIPEEYKIDSIENRLQLLAGLLDTDGTMVSKDGHYSYKIAVTHKRERLKDEIKELVQSCGFYCGQLQDKTTKAYVLTVFGAVHKIPTKIKRKQAGVNIGGKNSLHTGFKVVPVGVGEYYGFAVDDNHLFLLADGTIVHNTYFGAEILYEYTSRTANAHAGIQSKVRPDAQDVFQTKLIQPWRKLIDFFRPEYDTSKGDVPKSELRFFKPSSKGSKASDEYEEGLELESWIDFESSEPHAYDGQKLHRYLCDEIFKTEIDILKRHNVIKPCLENEDGDIIGKAMYTSTVEDMEGYLGMYIKLWNDSDMKVRNENGRTISGLYRWFTPAQKIMYVNKYGIPDVQRALDKIENELKGMDARGRADYIRRFPRTWKEAFRTASDNCLFDPEKLDNRIAELAFIKEGDIYERYNLIPSDTYDEDYKVRLVKNKNGRFRFSKKFLEWFSGQENDVSKRGSQFIPKNILRLVIGVDPFDHSRTKDGHFSQGAAAVFLKFDPLDPDITDNFVGYYVARPSNSTIFYEDILHLCHYLSCQMLYEDQKPKIADHFIDNGHGAFLVRDAKGNHGISASTKAHQIIADHIEEFIDNNCQRVEFIDMLNDWKDLDLSDTTKFDLGMATGYALIAAAKIKRKEKKLSRVKGVATSMFVRKYRLKKSRGRTSLRRTRYV